MKFDNSRFIRVSKLLFVEVQFQAFHSHVSISGHDLRVARIIRNGVSSLTDAVWVPVKAPMWISLMPSSLISLGQKLRPAARNLSRLLSAHEKFLNESSEDKAVNDIEMKRKTVQRELTRLNSNLKKELEGSQGESSSLTTVDLGVSYKVTVQQRKKEIQSLKEAPQRAESMITA